MRKFRRYVSLPELNQHKEGALAGMPLLTRPRLSVQRVTREQWDFILALEAMDPE